MCPLPQVHISSPLVTPTYLSLLPPALSLSLCLSQGMYQHDLSEKSLQSELESAVQSCVCKVGVDVNTASAALLAHVPGLNAARADAIFNSRPPGGYRSRDALRKVKGIGPKTFEQAAGFLRLAAIAIADESQGGEVLDCTAVHPESYANCRALLAAIGHEPDELRTAPGRAKVGAAAAAAVATAENRATLAAKCGLGERALAQVVEALSMAERDAREALPGPLLLGTEIRTLEQLETGQRLRGVVRNVTPFGAFVNVGLKDDGLLHASEMRKAVGAPGGARGVAGGAGGGVGAGGADGVSASSAAKPSGGGSRDGVGLDGAFVGQLLDLVVLSVDLQRRRLSLGLATDGAAPPAPPPPPGKSGVGGEKRPAERATAGHDHKDKRLKAK